MCVAVRFPEARMNEIRHTAWPKVCGHPHVIVAFHSKTVGISLLLYKHPLVWEGFLNDFGSWLRKSDPIHPQSVQASEALPTFWGNHFFMYLTLCMGA